jgi:hypothetical protein
VLLVCPQGIHPTGRVSEEGYYSSRTARGMITIWSQIAPLSLSIKRDNQ